LIPQRITSDATPHVCCSTVINWLFRQARIKQTAFQRFSKRNAQCSTIGQYQGARREIVAIADDLQPLRATGYQEELDSLPLPLAIAKMQLNMERMTILRKLTWLIGMLGINGCEKAAPSVPSPMPVPSAAVAVPTKTANKTYTRAEFKKLVVRKTQAEILNAIGKPNHMTESKVNLRWFYDSTTYELDAKVLDQTAVIEFQDDTGVSVSFIGP
jgi:hypothetical protein